MHRFSSVQPTGQLGGSRVCMDLKEMRTRCLSDVRAVCQGPWLVLGDYNLIVKAEDKNNGNLNRAMMGRFRRLINDMVLHDLPLHGRKFTWSNQ